MYSALPQTAPDGQSAADDLAISRQVRAHAEMGLRAADVAAESSDDFIEHESASRLRRDLARRVQKTRAVAALACGFAPAQSADTPIRARWGPQQIEPFLRAVINDQQRRARVWSGMPGATGAPRRCPSTVTPRTSTSSLMP